MVLHKVSQFASGPLFPQIHHHLAGTPATVEVVHCIIDWLQTLEHSPLQGCFDQDQWRTSALHRCTSLSAFCDGLEYLLHRATQYANIIQQDDPAPPPSPPLASTQNQDKEEWLDSTKDTVCHSPLPPEGSSVYDVQCCFVSNHLTLLVLVLCRDRACYSRLVLVSLGASYQ